jgi:hypothetical protein
MKKLNMISNNFSHAFSSTWWKKPSFFEWDFHSRENQISVYIDKDLFKGIEDKNNDKIKILWLLESKNFDGGAFEYVQKNLDIIKDNFVEVWTHSEELLNLDHIFKWCPAYGTYIESIQLYEKSKLISMITSNKTFTEQQRYRYDFAKRNQNKIDLFGRGFLEIEKKELGLCDYMFSICIENNTYDTYFTEKILDCFATGTIPIYKGTKNIIKYFDGNGILFLDDINLDEINSELYYSKLDSIKKNLELVKQYNILEDWIYHNHLKKYLL